jgi:hypothetical protein
MMIGTWYLGRNLARRAASALLLIPSTSSASRVSVDNFQQHFMPAQRAKKVLALPYRKNSQSTLERHIGKYPRRCSNIHV